LAVGELVRVGAKNRRAYVCQCDCGEVRTVLAENLTSGRQKSCGCLSRDMAKASGERSRTHGMHKSRTYGIWHGMKNRCQTSKSGAYVRYGARGVTVCERWQTFENFFADMGEAPDGLTLDRIDNTKGYEPGNCRWATWTQQAANRRRPQQRSA
jgi:hypothetical protein